MILNIEHDILVTAPDLETAEHHIRLFFDKSQLVHYDSIEIDYANCANGSDNRFIQLITSGIDGNREILGKLLDKLKEEGGCENLDDILNLPQGFQSKLLHTMSHLLDGFFGVDTRFYDIDEISHWLTENRKKQIDESPESCWILRVKAQSVYGQGFEKKDSD